jgi:hypothetical protein
MKKSIDFIKYLINNTAFFFKESPRFVRRKDILFYIGFPAAYFKFIKMMIKDYVGSDS